MLGKRRLVALWGLGIAVILAGLSSGAPAQAQGSPGVLRFLHAGYSRSESQEILQLTVLREVGGSGELSGDCVVTGTGTATAGSDFVVEDPQDTVVTFAAGETGARSCVFHVIDDAFAEGPETFTVSLVGPYVAEPSQSTVTIQDNDEPGGVLQFSSPGFTGSESNPVGATVQVKRSGSAVGEVSVTVSTVAGGSASPGLDYTAGSAVLTWADNDSLPKTFTVSLTNDELVEGNETVRFELSAPTGDATLGQPSAATFNIADDEPPPAQPPAPPLTYPPPILISMHPLAGPESGGTVVTIAAFYGVEVDARVTIGGIPCRIPGTSGLKCLTPPGAGMAEIVVETEFGTMSSAGTGNDFHYTDGHGVPAIYGITPGSGPKSGGTPISITGWNFLDATGVTVGPKACRDMVVQNAGLITCVTPSKDGEFGGTQVLTVTGPGGSSTPGTAAGGDNNHFDYRPGGSSGPPAPQPGSTPPPPPAGAPVVGAIIPASGSPGDTVAVSGTNLANVTLVTFGSVPAEFTVGADGQLAVKVPAGVAFGPVDIRVTNSHGTSPNISADDFSVETDSANPPPSQGSPTAGSSAVYTLFFPYTFLVWSGEDGISPATALDGIADDISAIWAFVPETGDFAGFFPDGAGVPGANDLSALRYGVGYFIALKTDSPITWTSK